MTTPLECFRTDHGRSDLLFAAEGRNMRYCKEWKSWVVWNNETHRWTKDDSAAARKYVKVATAWRQDLCTRTDRKPDLEDKLGNLSTQETTLRYMANGPETVIHASMFDLQLDELNCPNTSVDLRTGELIAQKRESYHTKSTEVNYDPSASKPERWLQFIDEITCGRNDLADYLQRVLGSGLSGRADQVGHFFYGEGGNGKTILCETLTQLLGSYVVNVPASILVYRPNSGDGASPGIAKLNGSRLAFANELNEGQRLDEAMFKTLTGEDTISARFLNENLVEFSQTWTLILRTNHKPGVRETGEAIWRRVQPFPFDATFSYEIGNRDDALKDRLLDESEGILKWLVDGAKQWYDIRLKSAPKVVSEEREVYKLGEDRLGSFLKECTIESVDGFIPTWELLELYRVYTGERLLTMNAFSRMMKKRGDAFSFRVGEKKGRSAIIGLKWNDPHRVGDHEIGRM